MSIKNWMEDDRPREKFYQKGGKSCSNSEIIAILLGHGTKELSAVDLAKKILDDNNNSLDSIGKLSIKELTKYKGIGVVKAITLAAALELGSRRASEKPISKPRIHGCQEAFEVLQTYFLGINVEEFYIMLLNNSHRLLKIHKLSSGSSNATVVDVKSIAKLALDYKANFVILAHNHPSGNPEPSDQDKDLTKKIKNGLELFDIGLLDHLIIYENDYTSFADNGLLKQL